MCKLIDVLVDQSTAALSSLSESYTNLDTLLSSSRNLVSTLLHSQKSDTWYLESTFWILVGTITWLVFRRILYGPGWWLLYLPTKLALRITIFIVHLVFGAFTFLAGAVGANSKSTALNQVSSQVLSTLQGPPSATGELPTFDTGMSAPSIHVGGGGKGQPPPQKPQEIPHKLSDTVGEMAEKTSQASTSGSPSAEQSSEETKLRERGPDELPNPKKRMWEENIASQEECQPRDEL